MLAGFSSLLLGLYSHGRAGIVLLSVGYSVVAIQALRHKRWAIIISIIVAFLLMIRWLPMVIMNGWMFITGDELYLDSPATIFIVLIYTVLFAIPSTVLSVIYTFKYKTILEKYVIKR